MMDLFKSDVLKDLSSLQDRMNRIFSESVQRFKEIQEEDDEKVWVPSVDIFELENALVLLAELPGVPKEGVTIDVKGDTMTIRGNRPPAPEVAGGSLFRSERRYGPFERSFTLPVNLAAGKIQARMCHGVLAITIEKPDLPERRITIDIE